jgi:hypothetical protein
MNASASLKPMMIFSASILIFGWMRHCPVWSIHRSAGSSLVRPTTFDPGRICQSTCCGIDWVIENSCSLGCFKEKIVCCRGVRG